jgi:hypothetical protein
MLRRPDASTPNLLFCRRLLLAVMVIAALVAATGPATGSADRPTSDARLDTPPIGVHSMLYVNTPPSAMKAMFRQAYEMGASEIRLNIEVSSVFPGPAQSQGSRAGIPRLPRRPNLILSPRRRNPSHPNPLAHPHWTGVDEYMRLARMYHLRVLAVLTSTPAWMANCPRGTPSSQLYRCPPAYPRQWGRAVGEIAHHVRGVIDDFEILNEPDGRWSFLGSPQQYAAILATSYTAIHAADGTARVALGGLMRLGPGGERWMDNMLATPGTEAVHSFDLANIHLRLPPWQVSRAVCQWRGYFTGKGFEGPLWVTETGYPAKRSAQTDYGYEFGPLAQARWLTTVIPAMLAGGVGKIFVTERDLSGRRFGSEGILQTPNPLPPSPTVKRRPSFYAVQRLAQGAWFPAELRYARHAPSYGGQGGSTGAC